MALFDEEDKADIDAGLEYYRKWKLTKALAKKAEAEAEQDVAIRWKRLEQELEVARLKALEGLSAEVLMMATKDPGLQTRYHNQALDKIRGQFTPDRIAALRLGENPELDKTLKEVILGLHSSGKLEQFERLVKEIKENAGVQRDIYEKQIQTLMQMFTQALETARNIARGD